MIDTQHLRQKLKAQRKQLPISQQHHLSAQMVRHLLSQTIYQQAKTVALYLPVNGEADPRALFEHNLDTEKTFYLPVLADAKTKQLSFMQWHQATCFQNNIYAIPEPVFNAQETLATTQLDLVLMPLVAFDSQGNRLGMGGGYYDRSFAFKRQNTSQEKPFLVGYAYDFQMQSHLVAQAWDIPLNAYVTETGFKKV